LENFRDALFRENGACVHSFLVKNPRALPGGSAGRRFAVEDATVHPLSDKVDARTPHAAVCAEVKWANDELDDPARSLSTRFPLVALATAAKNEHVSIEVNLRALAPDCLKRAVLVASARTSAEDSVDAWGEREVCAVDHLMHSLSILGVAGMAPALHAASAHATLKRAGADIEMVAVLAGTHEDADKHVRDKLPAHRGQLLVVTRDSENTTWGKEFGSILERSGEVDTEAKFTDPTSAVVRLGYQNLLHAYRTAQVPADVYGLIDAAFS
jgi:hypothetical protein